MKLLKSIQKLNFGFGPSPFGECCIVFSEEGVSGLIFATDRESAKTDIAKRFQEIELIQNDLKAETLCNQIFVENIQAELCVKGTDFQFSVWEALCDIPVGTTSTYAQIAEKIGKPKAVRAVGTAIGVNPVAWFIPCHRVLRSNGGLGGFRWGLALKKKMLEVEAL